MIGRYLPAAAFLAAGAFVLWYNATYVDSTLLLPFIDTIYPAAKGDLDLQGRITGIGFLVIGALFLARAIWTTVTEPKDQRYS